MTVLGRETVHDAFVSGETARRPPPRLIGRDEVVEHVERLVRRPGAPIVTLTGRSGVGKTAVALEVTRRIREEDGLGILGARLDRHSARAGLDEVAALLSLPSEGPGGPAPRGRRRIVLLDGLESAPGAAALVHAR